MKVADKFYIFLENLFKSKLNQTQIKKLLILYSLYKGIHFKNALLNSMDNLYGISKSGLKKKDFLIDILDLFETDLDSELFIFGLKLIAIKPLLLQEAKTRDLLDTSKLPTLNPLSLAYDKITLFSPYSTRVSGALLSLIFFDKLENKDTVFISSDTTDFLKELSYDAIKLKKIGVEPNQIFMLMFSESINQSIISDSGSNYEDRILSVLMTIGIDKNKIVKTHDKDDSSTEFDFFFELDEKTYGIGAKRTLRERYKQFIKTAQMTKIKAIRNHNVFLFISDEIYSANEYLQNTEGVFSSKDLTLHTLKKLV